MSNYLYYTEFLPRIGIVSVSFESSEIPNGTVQEEVNFSAKDGSDEVTVTYRKKSWIISLSNIVKKISKQATKQNDTSFSVRLYSSPVSDDLAYSDRSSSLMAEMGQNYPWRSKYLQQCSNRGFSFICNSCGSCLLESKNIENILEMPSESWAEMMDMWFCHRDKNTTAGSGIISGSNFIPRPQGLFVGPSYILLNKQGSWKENINELSSMEVVCTNCNTVVGVSDSENSFRINKWNMNLSYSNKITNFDTLGFVYSVIMDSVHSHTSRHFEIYNEDTDKLSLLVWVLNIGISFTSTNKGKQSHAMKILYSTELNKYVELRKGRGEFEGLYFSSDIIKALIESLEKTNESLPSSVKLFDSWKVGFLDKPKDD